MCCLREVIFQYYYNTWFCLENKTYLLFLIIQLVKKKGFQKFLGLHSYVENRLDCKWEERHRISMSADRYVECLYLLESNKML